MDPKQDNLESRRPTHPWTAILPITLLAALLWALTAATPAAIAAEVRDATAASPEGVAVYRCRGANGGIEFRNGPCPPGSEGESLVVEDHPIGWTPAPPTPAPKRAATERKAKAGTRAGRGTDKGSAHSAQERQEEICWKKRQQVEEIDRKLRIGTRGRQGTELRHRRSVAEEYLDAHCD